jgi:lysophospholipase
MTPDAPFYADVADAPEGAHAYWLTASDGTRLRAVVWQGGARGTAVVFPGRTEFAEKYGRVAGELVALGLSVIVVDWRGQGLSDRYAPNPMLGHVEDFRIYQRDVAALMALEAELDLPGPRYLVAHSMGGCIGLRTLLERAEFCGAILSAPMWHLQMKAATRELTTKMTRLANVLGFGGRLMPGTRAQPTMSIGYEGNSLTTDLNTFAWCFNQITVHPDLALGGPSMQWTYAALEEMARLYVAPLPKLPMLVMLGSEETVVSASVIRSQVAQMAEGELVELEGARHEIFMETPEIRSKVFRRIEAFLEAVPARRGNVAATGS